MLLRCVVFLCYYYYIYRLFLLCIIIGKCTCVSLFKIIIEITVFMAGRVNEPMPFINTGKLLGEGQNG